MEILALEGNPITSISSEVIEQNTRSVLNVLEQAREEKQTSVDLRFRFLVILPPEIGNFSDMTELNLGGNQLSSFPSELWQLENLTHLDLSDNKLTKLPAEIGQLRNLRELTLVNNQLSDLPVEIADLPNLKTLKLSGNPLNPDLAKAYRNRGLSSIIEYLRNS